MQGILRTLCAMAVVAVATGPAWAGAGTLTVNLLDSSNGGLSGGSVYYYDGGWQLLGTTNGTGVASGSVPKTTDIEIRYAGGKYKWVNVDPSTSPPLTINTLAVTVKLETCDGAPLLGEAKYYFGGEAVIGNTPATIELLPYSGLGPGQGCYDFRMSYEGRTSPWQRQDVAADPVVVFKTTKVQLLGQNIFYYKGGWQPFAPNPMEMMGGTTNIAGRNDVSFCDFKFGGMGSPTVSLQITGCSVTAGVLTLLDGDGHGLAGGKATPATGGSWNATVPGETDAAGHLFAQLPPGFTKIRMTVNQTSEQQSKTQLDGDGYTWQTTFVPVWVKDSIGTGIAGVQIDQGGGFWDTNKLVTDGGGMAALDVFAGFNPKLRANYNHTSMTLTAPNDGIEYVFQTGAVHSDAATCTKWATGSWNTFTQDMEVFPGSYKFVFSDFATTVYGITGGTVNHIH